MQAPGILFEQWRPRAMCTHLSRLAVSAAALLAASASLAQHAGDIQIGSTAAGGGALAVAYDFSNPIRVTRTFGAGGVSIYSGTSPGIDLLVADRPGEGLFVLQEGVRLRGEITSIDSGVSMQISGVTVDAAGESAELGTAPNIHVHPVWRLTLPDGIVGDYRVSFRLSGTRGYQPSVAYTVVLTNREPGSDPSPTATATVTEPPSATPTPNATPLSPTRTRSSGGPCPGDCNGDNRVTVNELVTGVNIVLGIAPIDDCASLDTDASGRVTVNELVQAVTGALRGCEEEGV